MATTAVRPTTLSSSYVPRNRDGSRPASPAFSSSYQPRPRPDAARLASPSPVPGSATPRERAGSSLKHEVKEEQVKQELKVLDEKTLQNARDILDLLSALPRPLPELLPNKSLKKPAPVPSTDDTFTDHVHSYSAREKRKRELRRRGEDDELVGLGLSLDTRANKRNKRSPDIALKPLGSLSKESRSNGTMTPTINGGRPAPVRRRSSNGQGEGKEWARDKWSRDRWAQESAEYNRRAVLCKRHGDAMNRASTAKPEFVAKLPHDPQAGMVALTDSVLLFLYSFWCTDQSEGRALYRFYENIGQLSDAVRQLWETDMRRSDLSRSQAEMNRGMVGLMYLIAAMREQQMSVSMQGTVQSRQRELSTNPSSNPSTTPTSASHHISTAGPSGARIGPSPPSSTSPSGQIGPSPISSNGSDSLPSDFLNSVSQATEASNKAMTFLQNSRFYLSLRVLREYFPRTYETAVSTDLSDQALPAPGDMVGSGRDIDPDDPTLFAWPIELGMSAGISHLVVFGRSMIEEYAEKTGTRWERRLEST